MVRYYTAFSTMLPLKKNNGQSNAMYVSKGNLDYRGNISFLCLTQFTMETDQIH